MNTRRRLVTCSVVALVGIGANATAARQAGTQRTVYFSATDAKGAAVTDLTAADLVAKENGKDRQIADVRPATEPMQVSILVDDAGTGAFQAPIAQFLKVMLGHGQFAISLLNPQPRKLVNFTDDVGGLNAALQQLVARGRLAVDGEQIVEAVADAAKELRERKAPRPVILVLSASGEAESLDRADFVLKELRDSRASLNVLHVTGLEVGKVLGDGPKQSGGLTQQVSGSIGLGPVLARISDQLLHQFVLTYTLPDGVKLSERFSLTTIRKGVTLLAPSRLPEK